MAFISPPLCMAAIARLPFFDSPRPHARGWPEQPGTVMTSSKSSLAAAASSAALDRGQPTQATRAQHDRMANAIRALAMDGVEQAKSGHPGLPMGVADIATVLFTRFLKFDPADPAWPDRDR